MLKRLKLVLVGPRTPGNVGACARVAANFGCRDWVIADAQCEWDGWDARKYATGAAREALDGVVRAESLAEAVNDCQVSIGFTRRQGKERKPSVELGDIARLVMDGARVALVFGNEETGLSSEELEACTRLCMIPTEDAMPSMNLSHAVAVVLSRVYGDLAAEARGSATRDPGSPKPPARIAEYEGMISHWEEFLRDIGMNTAGNPERLLVSLRRIFSRADLVPQEVRALRGMLSKSQVKLGVRKRGRRV